MRIAMGLGAIGAALTASAWARPLVRGRIVCASDDPGCAPGGGTFTATTDADGCRGVFFQTDARGRFSLPEACRPPVSIGALSRCEDVVPGPGRHVLTRRTCGAPGRGPDPELLPQAAAHWQIDTSRTGISAWFPIEGSGTTRYVQVAESAEGVVATVLSGRVNFLPNAIEEPAVLVAGPEPSAVPVERLGSAARALAAGPARRCDQRCEQPPVDPVDLFFLVWVDGTASLRVRAVPAAALPITDAEGLVALTERVAEPPR